MTSQSHHAQQEISLKLLAAASLAFFLIALGQFSLNDVDTRAHLAFLKLAKFSASLAIYAATMLWLLKQVTSGRQLLAWAATGASFGGVLELSTLLIQALVPGWQTELLAIGRLAILPPTFLIILAFRQLLKENIPQALRKTLLWATGLAIFGCLPGVMLLEVSQHQTSTTLALATDLKLAHFIGLHTLQLMPLTYFLVSKQTSNSEKQIKVVDTIGLSLLILIAMLTARSSEINAESTQAIATFLLALCAVFLATSMGSKRGHPNTTPGGNILFGRSKF